MQWRVRTIQGNDYALNVTFKSGHAGSPVCLHILIKMKRAYTFFYLQCFFVYALCGQGNTFNMAKAFPYPQTEFTHMILHVDTIVVYGVGFNNNVSWKQGVAVIKLDTFGNVLSHNFIIDAKGDLLATDKAWGNIIRTSDGGYAAIAATVYRKSAFLIKLSSDLQVEFIKEYPDTVNLSNYLYKVIEVPEGYLLYGAIQRPDYYNDGFIRYVDKQGETIWFKYIAYSDYNNRVMHIHQLNDSLYIAGIGTTTNLNPNRGIASFLHFTIEGADLLLWHSEEEPKIGYFRRFVSTSTKEIIGFSLHKIKTISNRVLVQPTIFRIDSTFRPIWVKHSGRIAEINASVMFWDFATTSNGDFIGVGETLVPYGDDQSRRVGWLYKFSAQGDSLWERKIDLPFLPLDSGNDGFLAGVGVLSSGNIFAAGSANEGNKQYCWLVKLTHDGCLDTLLCHSVSTTIALPRNQVLVDVFPNPASGYFNVESPISIQQITVFDALGHPVFRRQHLGTFARVDLPAHLSAGWYIVSLQDESGNTAYRKIYVYP